MDNYTLESFIEYCDDMMIVEEGFNIKNIGNVIQTVIETIKQLVNKITNFINKKLSSCKTAYYTYVTYEAYKLYDELQIFWLKTGPIVIKGRRLDQSNNGQFKFLCSRIKEVEINNGNIQTMVRIDDAIFRSFLSGITDDLNCMQNRINKLNLEVAQCQKNINFYKNENNPSNDESKKDRDDETYYMQKLRDVQIEIETAKRCISFCNELFSIVNYIRDNGYHVKK